MAKAAPCGAGSQEPCASALSPQVLLIPRTLAPALFCFVSKIRTWNSQSPPPLPSPPLASPLIALNPWPGPFIRNFVSKFGRVTLELHSAGVSFGDQPHGWVHVTQSFAFSVSHASGFVPFFVQRWLVQPGDFAPENIWQCLETGCPASGVPRATTGQRLEARHLEERSRPKGQRRCGAGSLEGRWDVAAQAPFLSGERLVGEATRGSSRVGAACPVLLEPSHVDEGGGDGEPSPSYLSCVP